MAIFIQGLLGHICLAYIDDVIVFSKKLNEHISDLEQVFSRIRGAGLKLKPRKCHLFKTRVLYLGHVVTNTGVLPDSTKIEQVQNWRQPETMKEMQSFLGFVNFYSDFIHHCSDVAGPLYDACKNKTEFYLTPTQIECFSELKKRLTSAPLLVHPDIHQPFILQTDASNIAIGAVLLQKQSDNTEKPVAY